MDGLAVIQCYNAKVSRSSLAWLLDWTPVPHSSIALSFTPDRCGENLLTPTPLDVRALAQDLFLKIARRFQGTVSPTPALFLGKGRRGAIDACSPVIPGRGCSVRLHRCAIHSAVIPGRGRRP
jgi:hypothetical protein